MHQGCQGCKGGCSSQNTGMKSLLASFYSSERVLLIHSLLNGSIVMRILGRIPFLAHIMVFYLKLSNCLANLPMGLFQTIN